MTRITDISITQAADIKNKAQKTTIGNGLAFFMGSFWVAIAFSPGSAFAEEVIYEGDTSYLKTLNGYFASSDTNLSIWPLAGTARLPNGGSHLFPSDDPYSSVTYSASGNTIDFRSGAVAGNVYGGIGIESGQGSTGNETYITGGTIGGTVTGGWSFDSDVTGNTTEISGVTTVRGNIYGGWVDSSNANANSNSVVINSGSISDDGTVNDDVELNGNIYGAYIRSSGTAVSNSVTINNGEMTGRVSILGAYGSLAGGKVENNMVTIKNGIIDIDAAASSPNIVGRISGGRGISTTVISGNSVVIQGGQTTAMQISGGANDGGSGAVYGNSVSIIGGTITTRTSLSSPAGRRIGIYGGINTNTGAVYENSVSITGGSTTGNVYGGSVVSTHANAGAVYENSVSITGGSTAGTVYGGHTTGANVVFRNTVSINADDRVTDLEGVVSGGYSTSVGHVYDNHVTVGGANLRGTLSFVHGGWATSSGGVFYPQSGIVSGNSVTIKDGDIGFVYGGRSESNEANDNWVTISGGKAENIYGGATTNGSAVSGNSVMIEGGASVQGAVRGGSGGLGGVADVSKNTVMVNDGTVMGAIYGGESTTGAVSQNEVVISGGSVRSVYAGSNSGSLAGAVTDNTVTLYGGTVNGSIRAGDARSANGTVSGNSVAMFDGTVTEDIYAGFHSAGANATVSGNSVAMYGGTVRNIYAGYAEGPNGAVTGNTAALYGGMVYGDIYAGYNSNSDAVTDNAAILAGGTVGGTVYGTNRTASWQTDQNRLTASGGLTTVGGIKNFQYADIYGGAIVNVTQNAAEAAVFQDLANSGLLSFYNEAANQGVARIMGAYSGSGQFGLDVLLGQNATATSADSLLFDTAPASPVALAFKALPGSTASSNGTLIKIAEVTNGARDDLFTSPESIYGIYTYEILRDGNEYFLGLKATDVGETGKVYSEASAVGLAQVALASDTFLRNSLENAISVTAGRGFGISASLGYSSQRIDTGSHADLEGASGLITLAYNQKGSPLAMGVFAEMFSGRYETSNLISLPTSTFRMKSKGDLESYGGGLFVQYRKGLGEAIESNAFTAWTPGLHLEALARVGHSKMDFRTNASNPSQFDNKGSMYYGASLGGGFVFEPAPKVAVDLYGHGTWTRLSGKSIEDNLAHRIEFKDADSLRFVAGFRASYAADERLRPYVGLAADWEALGKPKVYIDGYKADRADLSGLSGLIELGVNGKVGKSVFVDVKAAGSVGKRQGIGGMMEVKYEF
ncbi:MAG: hypothetical protein LBE22_12695 [Azoarcus sp.]|jgi:hypothetical protein|nr:hypothetical protein [Azoarcus sp.]